MFLWVCGKCHGFKFNGLTGSFHSSSACQYGCMGLTELTLTCSCANLFFSLIVGFIFISKQRKDPLEPISLCMIALHPILQNQNTVVELKAFISPELFTLGGHRSLLTQLWCFEQGLVTMTESWRKEWNTWVVQGLMLWWYLIVRVDPDRGGNWSWTMITTRLLDIQYVYSDTPPLLTITPQFIYFTLFYNQFLLINVVNTVYVFSVTSGIYCTSVRPGRGIPHMWLSLRFLHSLPC